MIYNDETATVLDRKEVTEGKANCPTIVTEYACPCGKGKIVTNEIRGFGEYFASLQCPECAAKYHVLTGCGHLWELRERK